jgi:hypothetical protein
MFAFLFRSNTSQPEDSFDIEAACETMRGRMDALLESDARRKTRFAVIENPWQ